MKQILIYYSFIIVSLMTFAGFVTASSIPELLSAMVFFPLAVYFAALVIPRNKQALKVTVKTKPTPLSPQKIKTKALTPPGSESAPELEPEIIPPYVPDLASAPTKISLDIDRRKFIKLIGSAGLSV